MIEEKDLPVSEVANYEKEKMQRVFSDFIKGNEAPKEGVWIWEDEFEHYFLPRILGHVEDDTTLWMGQWLEISNSFSVPMGIKCPRTEEILFYCPPLLNTHQLKTYQGQRSLGNVVTTAQNKSANLPGSGNSLFNSYIEGVFATAISGIDFSEVREQWKAILTRYNYVQIIDGQKVPIGGKPVEVPKAVEEPVVEELSVDDIFG